MINYDPFHSSVSHYSVILSEHHSIVKQRFNVCQAKVQVLVETQILVLTLLKEVVKAKNHRSIGFCIIDPEQIFCCRKMKQTRDEKTTFVTIWPQNYSECRM